MIWMHQIAVGFFDQIDMFGWVNEISLIVVGIVDIHFGRAGFEFKGFLTDRINET